MSARARSRARALGPSLARALDRVGADRRLGAAELADRTLRAIAREVARAPDARSEGPWLAALARRLDRLQPAMAVFRRWARELRGMAGVAGVGRRRRAFDRWLDRERERPRREAVRLDSVVRRRMPPHARILTLSRGSTLRRALEGLPGDRRPSEIVVLESRPGGEGRRFAQELRRAGLPARWVADRRYRAALRDSTAVLLGADALYPDGTLVHKVGTRRLANAARRLGVPVYVVSGESKLAARRSPPRALPRLFDRTPARCLSEFWTDRGAFSAGRWRRRWGPARPSARRA